MRCRWARIGRRRWTDRRWARSSWAGHSGIVHPASAMSNAPPESTALESRWIGRVVDGRYKIVEVLGEGGMGAVFVAEHLRLRKQVAFKTIRAEFAAHTQAEARFEREALATGRLDHPHVASAIDYGPLPEGGFYLVTQLVRGESLSKRLEAGSLPWPQVCLLGSQIADALAAAHALGIIHRDLKPDNILLEQRRDGALHVRVVDFGIARVSGEQATIADVAQPLTRMGAVIGTPGYMPPEQGTGQQVDFRADLYALGAVLWESVTGQQLWQGDTLVELLMRQLGRPAPSLRADVPEAMAVMVERLLARAPAERPGSALEVRDELRRLVVGNEVSIPPAVSSSAALSSAGSAVSPLVPTPGEVTHADVRSGTTAATNTSGVLEPGTFSQRSPRGVWIGVAVALVLVVVVLAYGRSTTDQSNSETAAGVESAPVDTKPTPRATVDELIAEAPANYAEDVKMLLISRHPQARRLASETIAGAPSRDLRKIPEYLRDLARFELADDCDDKKAILKKFEAAEEARALSGLQAIAGGRGDPCELRDELTRLIARFESEA
ncbi:serine/threonine-protein kinase [Nannocystis sp. SCPEA4]|uniref:serine/threonine-protein kinase n=1 Tax=Nannocystis sp. SCPEA4 TaxID=2996787 RepID=UPI00226FEB85|nr:serine/threonine-protein kinase [Nannocystis sp. SCPEA4]MCY1061697.1 serine/threonine-protein kinase [Nannocystis sp. SCPEA4]